jgi:hypothetical protein
MVEIFLVSVITGFVMGLVITYWLRTFISHHVEQALREENDTSYQKVIKAYIEECDNQLLLYEYGSNSFIAQGPDWESLNHTLMKTYPGVMFDVPTSQIDKAKEFKQLAE